MLSSLNELRYGPIDLRSPLGHALAQKPHRVDAFMKTNAAAGGAHIVEVRCCRLFSDDRLVEQRANKRPGPRTDVYPVVPTVRNAGDGRRSVMTSGCDQFHAF